MRRLFPLLFSMLAITSQSHAAVFDYLQPLPSSPIIPTDNPLTDEKIKLGQQLYFDTRLSVDFSLSCNSCHNLAAGGDDDGATTRTTGRHIERSAPSMWNAAYQTVQFWDGRAPSLEQAAKEHFLDTNIMGFSEIAKLDKRLEMIPGYQESFKRAFGSNAKISIENITAALATYIRTLRTPNSAFDKYIKGDGNALNASAKRGVELFNDIGCISCHFGINFAGPAPGPAIGMGEGFYELFPNTLGSDYDKKYNLTKDVGRFLVTGDRVHLFMWRVPPLRNITYTAPYFHNGSVNSLEEAIRVMAKTQLQKNLTQNEVEDLKSFLESLNGEMPSVTLPRLPEASGYHVP